MGKVYHPKKAWAQKSQSQIQSSNNLTHDKDDSVSPTNAITECFTKCLQTSTSPTSSSSESYCPASLETRSYTSDAQHQFSTVSSNKDEVCQVEPGYLNETFNHISPIKPQARRYPIVPNFAQSWIGPETQISPLMPTNILNLHPSHAQAGRLFHRFPHDLTVALPSPSDRKIAVPANENDGQFYLPHLPHIELTKLTNNESAMNTTCNRPPSQLVRSCIYPAPDCSDANRQRVGAADAESIQPNRHRNGYTEENESKKKRRSKPLIAVDDPLHSIVDEKKIVNTNIDEFRQISSDVSSRIADKEGIDHVKDRFKEIRRKGKNRDAASKSRLNRISKMQHQRGDVKRLEAEKAYRQEQIRKIEAERAKYEELKSLYDAQNKRMVLYEKRRKMQVSNMI